MAYYVMKDDIYNKVLREMESFYGEIPNRRHFRQAIEEKLTEEDCEVWLRFPKHTQEPVTLEEVYRKDGGRTPYLAASVEKMLNNFFLTQWEQRDGIDYYVRNYIFKIALAYSAIPGFEDDTLTIACQDWFNTMVLGGADRLPKEHKREFRVVPREAAITVNEAIQVNMNIDIPDRREVVPYDVVTELIKSRRTIVLTSCECRKNKDAMGTRQCHHPVETCMLFDELGERSLQYGGCRQISVEEALEITRRGRDLGLVHNVSNAENPSVLCQCCSCCCGLLQAMQKNGAKAMNAKASRYVCIQEDSKCCGSGKCAEACPVKAIEMVGGKPRYNATKCIGCGICITRCPNGARSLRLRPNAQDFMPEYKHFDVLTL